MATGEEEPRIIRLKHEEDGREVWLDTQTGQQLLGVVEREEKQLLSPHIAAAVTALKECGFYPNVVNASHVCCRVRALHAVYTVCFQTYEDRPMLTCTCEVPIRVPDADRLRAVDYLNRANWGLCFGGFELDARDGEVRFRVSVDVDANAASGERIRRMIHTVVPHCEQYFRGLMEVMFAGIEPAEAIKEAESCT